MSFEKRSNDDVMFLGQLLSATFEIVPCSLCLIYPIKPQDACFLCFPLKVSLENIQFTRGISAVLKSEEHFCSQTGKWRRVVPLSKGYKCHMERLGEAKSLRQFRKGHSWHFIKSVGSVAAERERERHQTAHPLELISGRHVPSCTIRSRDE